MIQSCRQHPWRRHILVGPLLELRTMHTESLQSSTEKQTPIVGSKTRQGLDCRCECLLLVALVHVSRRRNCHTYTSLPTRGHNVCVCLAAQPEPFLSSPQTAPLQSHYKVCVTTQHSFHAQVFCHGDVPSPLKWKEFSCP